MRVVGVEYLNDYKLKLFFSDNSIKIVNLENMLKRAKGVFLPLKQLDFFKQVEIDDCQLSICWPNGADICPDLLYKMGKEHKTVTKSRKRRIHTMYRKKAKGLRTRHSVAR